MNRDHFGGLVERGRFIRHTGLYKDQPRATGLAAAVATAKDLSARRDDLLVEWLAPDRPKSMTSWDITEEAEKIHYALTGCQVSAGAVRGFRRIGDDMQKSDAEGVSPWYASPSWVEYHY